MNNQTQIRLSGRKSLLNDGTVNFLLIGIGGLLFAAAFPNPLFRWGLAPVAFIALIPVVVVIRRIRFRATPVFGALYGLCTYALFNYWLAHFHPLAIFIVPLIYASYFFVLFPILKLVDVTFPSKLRFLGQAVIWIGYEYLRTRFYLGYAYGIIGYSQFAVTPLIQIADTLGVWGVSFLVVLPSFYLGHKYLARHEESGGIRGWTGGVAYVAILAAVFVYGIASPVDYSAVKSWRVALVQQNIDPWVGGFRTYQKSLDALVRQSSLAIEETQPDIVIWSETSFVPSIYYHSQYREDQQRYELVRKLLDYLADQNVPFVVGNSDGRLVRTDSGELDRVDYNAVLVFEGDRILDTYRKIHLVPFTEHFPYERQLPWLHRALVENNTNFWEKGSRYTVFEAAGVRFSTPICFEDTFGYLSRGFVQNGAEVIVNMTNDLWSFSEPAAMQHMAMAVFRAVENRRSVVRSTNGGITTIIDPNGRITDIYPPFVEGYLAGDVPVYTGTDTVYTRYGDWFAWVMVVLAVAEVLTGFGVLVVRRRNRPD